MKLALLLAASVIANVLLLGLRDCGDACSCSLRPGRVGIRG